MTEKLQKFHVHAPGRICLLGEHQDYLGLEVISGALNLGVSFAVEALPSEYSFHINLTQTNVVRTLDTRNQRRASHRDYLQSGLNVMLRRGFTFSRSFQVTVTGDLPIGKGVSSSSALCTGWIRLLHAAADEPVEPEPIDVARIAFEAEVMEFNEPGGMQDHIASALGGLVAMNFNDNPSAVPAVKCLSPVPRGFILVDSNETKETLGMISRIRNAVETQNRQLWPGRSGQLSQHTVDDAVAQARKSGIEARELLSTLRNRDIVRQAMSVWPQHPQSFKDMLPELINSHHQELSTGIGSSSPGIDSLIRLMRDRGVPAGKVIGSGGGGCLLLYAPDQVQTVCETLEQMGFAATPVHFGGGVSLL